MKKKGIMEQISYKRRIYKSVDIEKILKIWREKGFRQ